LRECEVSLQYLHDQVLEVLEVCFQMGSSPRGMLKNVT
jgi:hypothetical protein